jgi:hypothetical protein
MALLAVLGMAFGLSVVTAKAESVPSVDRVILDAAVERAQAEKKTVILEVAAAWCGPCTQFAYDMDTHPENFRSLASRGYLFLKGESEKVVEGTPLNLTDFLPRVVRFFPSFYVYTPAQGWIFLGSANSFADLNVLLENVVGRPPMKLAEIRTAIEALGTKGEDLNSVTPQNARLQAILNDVSANFTYPEAKQLVELLAQENAKYPNMGLGDVVDFIPGLFMPDYLGMGAVSFDLLKADFPVVAENLTDVSSDDFSNHMFSQTITYLNLKSGNAVAAQQCPAIWQSVRARFVKGTLSDADFQARLKSMDQGAAALCADLEWRVTGATDAVKRKVAALDPSKISDWALVAGLGNIDQAVAIYHAQFEEYAQSYNATLATLQKRLDQAVSAGNQTLADQIRAKMAVVKFQLENHTQVDSDVEGALKDGRAVQVLKPMN